MKLMHLHKVSRFTSKVSNKQSGFSLFELLIAMIIGLFLLAGITSSYLSSKKSSIARNQYSMLEDNGRIALEVITNTLKHAGYTSVNSTPLEDNFILANVTSNSCNDGTPNVINTGLFTPSSLTEDNDLGDSIGVIHLGDSSVFSDCSGGELPIACQITPGSNSDKDRNAAKIYSSIFLDGTKLQCAGSRDNALQTIAEGIDNIQIVYGVDENDDDQVDRYVNASFVGTWWNRVISVQVAVLARSLIEVKNTPEIEKFTLLDYEHTTPNDRYQRAVFSTTISLRNVFN